MLLLVFSFLSFSWEFTKILTYQSRFFSRTQVEQIDLRSNLFMYWPSRAYESLNGYTGNGSFWRYNICLLYTSPSPRDGLLSRMPSSA